MRLSFCIPTHDGRRDMLAAALDRLLGQIAADAPGEAEVCVTDNASADGTRELIEGLVAGGAPIRYQRHASDLGPACNVMASVALASGEWCWLHGSDDLIADGALRAVLDATTDAPDAVGITVARALFDLEMADERDADAAAVLPDDPERSRTFTDPREALTQLAVLHTFLTSQVVRRSAWERVSASDAIAAGRHYPHIYVIVRILLESGGPWVWIADKLALARPSWDIEAVGGSDLAAALTAPRDLIPTWTAALHRHHRPLRGLDGRLHRALLARAADTWAPPSMIRAFKARPVHTTRDDARMLAALTRAFWSLPRFWRTTWPLLACPHRVARRRARPTSAPTDRDLSITVRAAVPTTATTARNLWLACDVVNETATTLRADVVIGARWIDAAARTVRQRDRVPLPGDVRPGGRVRLTFAVPTPWVSGRYALEISAVREGVGWAVDADPTRGVRVVITVDARDAQRAPRDATVEALVADGRAPAWRGASHGLNRHLERLWESRADLQAAYPDLDGDDGAHYARWIRDHGCHQVPIPDALLPG